MADKIPPTNRPSRGEEAPSGIQPLQLHDFVSKAPASKSAPPVSLPHAELDVRIELGRAHLLPDEARRLASGSVVPLNKSAQDPVDVFVNGRLIARGEVVIHNENFCVRITELIIPKAASSQAA